MPAVLFLLLMSVIIGMANTNAQQETVYAEGQARSVAIQMAWYQSQALKACPTAGICPAGEIVVTADPGSDINVNNATFIAVTDTNFIVTTIRASAIVNQNDRMMIGRINAALKDITYNSLYAGPFDIATGNVYGSSAVFATTNVNGTPVPLFAPDLNTNTITPTIGGITLKNGYPVIITKVF
jgi:hypothetical protein